jgi:hypothetical protein
MVGAKTCRIRSGLMRGNEFFARFAQKFARNAQGRKKRREVLFLEQKVFGKRMERRLKGFVRLIGSIRLQIDREAVRLS